MRSAFWDNPLTESMRLLTYCAVPSVTYASLLTLPGAGSPVADPQVADAGRDRDQVRRLHRPPARRDRAAPGDGVGAASGRSRLPQRARTVRRGAAEAQPAQARDHRPGGAHFRHHAGGDLAAAGASESAARRPRAEHARRCRHDGGRGRVDARRATSPPASRRSGLRWIGAQRAQLAAYLALLAKWNKTYNLTAIREPARMVTHHLLDALAVVPHLPALAGVRILDVGSGGGVPGIPLAIARPDAHVVMIDSNHKKAAFLLQAAIELGLAQRRIARGARRRFRAGEALRRRDLARVLGSRRFRARRGARHLAPQGRLFAMKGVHPDEELAQLPREFVVARETGARGSRTRRGAASRHHATQRTTAESRARMTRIIAVANQKGGVGKTTTAVNLAASLVAMKRRVLLVDLDPQGNATTGSGLDKRGFDATVYQVLLGERRIADVRVRIAVGRLRRRSRQSRTRGRGNRTGRPARARNAIEGRAVRSAVADEGRDQRGRHRLRLHPARLSAVAVAAHAERPVRGGFGADPDAVRVLRAGRPVGPDPDVEEGARASQSRRWRSKACCARCTTRATRSR